MHTHMKISLTALLFILLTAAPSLAVNRDHIRELNKQAREYSKQNDWKSVLDIYNQLTQEMGVPTPIHMLRVASAEMHLGHTQEALRWMQRYAATGLTYDISTDDDLKPLLAEKDFAPIAAEMKEKSKPVTKAEIACTFPVMDIMPEDLTYESSSKTFIVSSVQQHTLYRVTLPKKAESECGLKEIPLEDAAKHWPTMAVSINTTRHLLWMTAAAMPGFEGFPKEDSGKTSLFALNLDTGTIVRRFDVDASGSAALGDMSVTGDGTVYVTDGFGGGVYRVRGAPETARLEKIADGFFSPQTPALAKDGKRLFVADYSLGIAVIDLETGKADYLKHPENIAVTGLDGLYLAGDSLLGVQNGTDPERIMRFTLNSAQTEIIGQEVIEQGPRIGDPTHVVIVDGMAYATANVGWDKVGDNGKLKDGAHFTAPILMRFPLK